MTEDMIFNMFGNIAAPVIICMYTLVEVNRSIKRLADSIDRFSDEVDSRIDKLERELRELTIEFKTFVKRSEHH